MIKPKKGECSLLFSLLMASVCQAEQAVQPTIKQQIERAMPTTAISAIIHSVIPGVYEIEAGKNIYYTDATGRYLVVGHIYDLESASDLTQQRLDRLQSQNTLVNSSLFPLEAQLTVGQGSRLVTILFDPRCAWCQRLFHEITRLKDMTVRLIFSVPEPHIDVTASLLCADKPVDALNQVMSGKALTETALEACIEKKKTALAEVNRLTVSFGLTGTPILIASDGRVHSGYLPPVKLRQWLTLP